MPGSFCAADMRSLACACQSGHVAEVYGSGYAMNRTPPASNQPQSSPPSEMAGEPGDCAALGNSNRPL